MIKALGYVFIESSTPEKWQHFMEQVVGLMAAPSMLASENQYFKMDAYTWRIAIKPSNRDCLSIAGWEVETQSHFEQVKKQLSANAIIFRHLTEEECLARAIQGGIQFDDPSGNTLEIFYQMALDYLPLISKVGVREFDTGFNGDMGLGHFVIPTQQFDETYDFYLNVLGFGQTDTMRFQSAPEAPEQRLHFLHVNNPRHHSLAIYEDPNPSPSKCVHLMVEVPDMDDVGYFIDRCKAHDIRISSTLGKHTNDLMTSVYVDTPAGFALEFGTGGLQLDWDGYKPTESARPSLWGHEWNPQ